MIEELIEGFIRGQPCRVDPPPAMTAVPVAEARTELPVVPWNRAITFSSDWPRRSGLDGDDMLALVMVRSGAYRRERSQRSEWSPPGGRCHGPDAELDGKTHPVRGAGMRGFESPGHYLTDPIH